MARQDQEHATLEQLSAYLDGALSSSEQAFCDAHLPHCEECRNRLAALRETVNLLRSLPRAEPTRSFVLTPELLSRSGSTPVITAVRTGELASRGESPRPLQRPGAVEERPSTRRRRRGSSLRITFRALSAIAAVLALLLLFSAIDSAHPYQLAPSSHIMTGGEESAASSYGSKLSQGQGGTPGPQSVNGSVIQPSSAKSTPTVSPGGTTTSQPAPGPTAFLLRLVPGLGLLLVSIAGFILTRRPRRQPS